MLLNIKIIYKRIRFFLSNNFKRIVFILDDIFVLLILVELCIAESHKTKRSLRSAKFVLVDELSIPVSEMSDKSCGSIHADSWRLDCSGSIGDSIFSESNGYLKLR